MAGARVVVVVLATTGAGAETACGAGAVVAGGAGSVVGGVGIGAVVTTVAVGGVGWEAAGFTTVVACPRGGEPRAATVPPAPPSTTTTATVATTILFLISGDATPRLSTPDQRRGNVPRRFEFDALTS
jgi:hypothetical protein